MRRLLFALGLAAALSSQAAAQYPGGPTVQSGIARIAPTVASPTDSSNRIATTAWVNSFVNAGLPLANGKIWIGSAGGIATAQTMSGDATLVAAGALTLATVNANVGAFGSATQCATITTNAKGLITAASATACTPPITAITGLGAGIATWLATASSANMRAAVTDETGTGLLYFQGGDIGTPSAGVGTNLTALNASNLGSGTVPPARLGGLGVLSTQLNADVAMPVANTFVDGPTLAQGSTGTWFVFGTVTLLDTTGASRMQCKLWDGTTVIAASESATQGAAASTSISLQGSLATPAGNLRITCKDLANTTGAMKFNVTGTSKDSTLSAFRIN